MQLFSTNMLCSFGFLLSTVVVNYGQVAAYTARQIYQFPSTPFVGIENVALRSNGNLLLTATSSPTIYTLDPTQANPSSSVLHTFSGANACLGITQTSTDVFAVVVGNVTGFTGVAGSFSIWSVNFLNPNAPVIQKIAAIPQAKILNGLTYLKSSPNIVLAADSQAGIVYSLNIATKVSAVAIQNSAFAATGAFPIGINGLHPDPAGSNLYFTNSGLGTFGSVPIDSNGKATGAVKIIANDPQGNTYDDFAVDSQGNCWITNHPSSLSEVTLAGKQTIILNSTTIVQPTSAIFATGGHTLYVVTGGESGTGSGQVFAITI